MAAIQKNSGAFNLSQASRYIGISRPTLMKFLPEIPHKKLGRRVVISRVALDKWLETSDTTEAK